MVSQLTANNEPNHEVAIKRGICQGDPFLHYCYNRDVPSHMSLTRGIRWKLIHQGRGKN